MRPFLTSMLLGHSLEAVWDAALMPCPTLCLTALQESQRMLQISCVQQSWKMTGMECLHCFLLNHQVQCSRENLKGASAGRRASDLGVLYSWRPRV